MDYAQLEHAIRAACQVAGDTEVYVFGSQAILGTYPQAPAAIRGSMEVDIQPKNRPEMTVVVDGALGEDSAFHREHRFWVHGIEMSPGNFPSGWQDRTVQVSHPVGTRGCIGYCLEAHDIAASKMAAGRDKDYHFVRTLLSAGLLSPETVIERLLAVPAGGPDRIRRAVASIRAWA